MNSKIHIIITGGTIDSKTKGQDRDALFEHSVVPEYLLGMGKYSNLEFTEVFMKDSRDITELDRLQILKTVEQSSADKIIITHETFTMVETAMFIKNKIKPNNQTIVLTGSMIPLKFEGSDAPENLAFALEKAQNLDSGVCIAMNKRIFSPEEAVKNITEDKFYSIHD